ncbi:unnamed protein product [Oikopleura dioica]|uniref:Uncharacterized protein n=1 Tax=Oikopleura dioica TaxID=34765 RepID=E4X6B1_OIKDI|nr:unnamed protein product [Oikopleura dioica]
MPIFCDFEQVERCMPSRDSELHPRKIKLSGVPRRRFYRSSLFPSQLIYCVYRGLLAAYFVAWFIVQIVSKALEGEQPKHFIYLTTWAETALNLHLIASFFTCLYGYLNETIDNSDNPSSTSSEIDLGNEKSNDKLLSATGRAGQIYSAHEDEPDKLLWFHKLSWVLYSFALDVGLSVTIAFWALLRTEFDAFSWHCHLVNSVGLILDLIVSDVPIRLLHFTWTWSFGLSYILMTWLLHKYSSLPYIYEGVLDWGDYRVITLFVVFGVCFALVPGCHIFAHWFQRGRNAILTRRYQKLTNSSPDISDSDGFGNTPLKNLDLEAPKTVAQPSCRSPQKKQRGRTVSGNYAKLENLPYSDDM